MSCGKTTPFFHPRLQGLPEQTRHLLPLLRRTCAQPIDQCPRLSTLQMPGVDILHEVHKQNEKKNIINHVLMNDQYIYID
jgi:hypothetical protein